MSEGDALLKAILANREDDTVRLVYADWLEENGQELRAEFIRVQCEKDRTPHISKHDGCKACELKRRGEEIAPQIHPPTYYFDFKEVEYTRGFISGLKCQWHEWDAYSRLILERQPIERVEFKNEPDWEWTDKKNRRTYQQPTRWMRLGGRKPVYIDNWNASLRDRLRKVLNAEWKEIVFEFPDFLPVNLGAYSLTTNLAVSAELLQDSIVAIHDYLPDFSRLLDRFLLPE